MPRAVSLVVSLFALSTLTTSRVSAQVLYPAPAQGAFTITRDVPFIAGDSASPRMDVYRPAGGAAGNSRMHPTLVFFTAGSWRAHAGYSSWARLMASEGIVAVLADLRQDGADDFRALLSHLVARSAAYGIDTAAIATFGASSNSSSLLAFVQDPRERRIKATIQYYGGNGSVTTLRRDLPLLFIRAGLDRPFVNASIDSVIMHGLTQNAPITVVNYAAGHHGFDLIDDNVVTRDLITQTIAFVKRATSPAYSAVIATGVGPATAASHLSRGAFAEAAAVYAELVSRSPNDALLRHAYGQALLGAKQYATACDEFDKLRGKGLGPRDLGVPAAQACLHARGPDAAVAWLATIPKRFLPLRLKDDPAFATLKGRADFEALFQP
jgi:hypothetical protein